MGSDKTTDRDEAAEINAEYVRRHARSHRRLQRDMAVIFDSRGMAHDRILTCLELDEATLHRMLAADGRLICTECVFDRHAQCDIVTTNNLGTGRCECPCSEP